MTKRMAIASFAAVAAVLGGLALFVFLGVYDVGADTTHWEVTRKVIEVVRDRAIEVRSKASLGPTAAAQPVFPDFNGSSTSIFWACSHLGTRRSVDQRREDLARSEPASCGPDTWGSEAVQ